MTTTTNQEIATTIKSQIGGKMFGVMTGAKNFTSIESGLQFSLPSRFALQGINKITITLNGLDLYDVTFYKQLGVNIKEIKSIDNVYFDQLQEVFTRVTGLNIRL